MVIWLQITNKYTLYQSHIISSTKQVHVFLVDQHHHNDYKSPNRKKQLIDKDKILSFIKDGKRGCYLVIFLFSLNLKKLFNETLNLIQNISLLLLWW